MPDLTSLRKLAVAHQNDDECDYCAGKFREIVRAFMDAMYEQRWRCGVFDSGYHNGCKCGPDDPHDGWGCGYQYRAPAYSADWWRKSA